MPVLPLSELSDWELKDPSQDMRGRQVVDDAGRRHGAVTEMLVDTDHQRVTSVRTEMGQLIPVEPLEIRGSEVLFHDRQGSGPCCCGPLAVAQRPGAADVEELRTGKQLRHSKVEAADGDIGSLRDVYFDNQTWKVRYLVIDTSKWLFGRRVLISPEAIILVDSDSGRIHFNLTRDQIKNSPSWDTDPPVSRQYEGILQSYYGWGAVTVPPGPAIGASLVTSVPYDVAVPPLAVPAQGQQHVHDHDEHLRSMKEVVGYQVLGNDGAIGRVGDFAFDARYTRVHSMIVHANKVPGERTVLLPVDTVLGIHWPEAKVQAVATKKTVAAMQDWLPYED